jgi:hypothetical protein
MEAIFCLVKLNILILRYDKFDLQPSSIGDKVCGNFMVTHQYLHNILMLKATEHAWQFSKAW